MITVKYFSLQLYHGHLWRGHKGRCTRQCKARNEAENYSNNRMEANQGRQ